MKTALIFGLCLVAMQVAFAKTGDSWCEGSKVFQENQGRVSMIYDCRSYKLICKQETIKSGGQTYTSASCVPAGNSSDVSLEDLF